MKWILSSLIFMSSGVKAWTLNNNFTGSFKDNVVKVKIAGNAPCSPTNAGLTTGELEELIKPAVDNFWNTVPTSALKLKPVGFSEDITNIYSGRLCSPTDDACITAAGTNIIPPVTDIIIACNDESNNFDGTEVLAVTVPNRFSGKKIAGAVILINDFNQAFGNLSQADKISVIAHEIGHAIGLGHPEDNPEALMHFRLHGYRRDLAQDDIDGVSYLYPIHGDAFGLIEGGLLGGCGTIQGNDKEPPTDPPFSQMGITLAVLIFLFELRRLFKRREACPPA